ncbi:hypothetical protein AC233_30990 [Burkholderia sp. HB1]|nr:hypothetical protein AC233_30990 [Burkholderia sp. HB1]
MSARLGRLKAIGRAWPQLLTMVAFMVAISLRFPLWFVMLSALVNGTVLTCLTRCFTSRRARAGGDPFLGVIVIGSGLASIALTLKWWVMERQLKLAPGMLLHMAGHTEATSNPALAWSSVLTQWRRIQPVLATLHC